MSGIARVFLIVHVTMAVMMVGAGYVYPIIMKNLEEKGPNRVPLIRVANTIARGFTMPFVVIQPLTGLGLILTTKDLWNPFEADNRWLFAAILLFVVVFILDTFVAAPAIHRMHAVAARGEFDSDAFEKDLGLLGRVGPVFGILFLIITLLMIWKPGAPNVHV
jgi:hypothetical protein